MLAQPAAHDHDEYRDLVELCPDLLWRLAPDATLHYLNATSAELLGRAPEPLLGRSFLSLVSPMSAEQLEEIFRQMRLEPPGSETRTVEIDHLHADGHLVPCEARIVTRRDDRGQPIGFVGVSRDIRERKQLEAYLRERKQFYCRIIETAQEGIISIDGEYKIIHINRKVTELLGYGEQELIGRSLLMLMGDEAKRLSELRRQSRLRGATSVYTYNDFKLTRKDGSPLIATIATSPLLDESGEFCGAVGMITDVTDRRRMEDELLRSRKLESIGLLAGGIAHDFNNILTAVVGNLSLARNATQDDERVARWLSRSEQAALRARDLTQQLLTFSKGGAPVKSNIAIQDLVRETCGFALRGSNVACSIDLPEDLWTVHADAGQINQVLNNLVINADQAMSDGGRLEIVARNVHLPDGRALPLTEGCYVEVTVADHGHGIAPDQLDRIFDPYFTTKSAGNGLGLATCYSIVRRHQGWIGVDSEVDAGTRFTFLLPAAPDEQPVAPVDESAPEHGSGRVLVMDDEPDVLAVAGAMLESLGYDAVTVADGTEAIAAYEQARADGHPFDALIMDLTIPGGMGGREALHRLLAIDPDVRALVSSGYSNAPILSEHEAHGFRGIVNKPYSLAELGRALARLLSDAPTA